MPEQTHPQYSTDRDRIDMLLGHQGDPDENHLTTASMLLNRYDGVQGADDLLEDLQKSLRAWGITRDELNTKCRQIWSTGWIPGQKLSTDTGSAFDNQDIQP